MTIQERYLIDPEIRALVDMLESAIHKFRFTPSEIRECAMLAAIRYEENTTRKDRCFPSEITL